MKIQSLKSLISVKELYKVSQSTNFHISESVYTLKQPSNGSYAPRDFLKSHIPGASYINLHEVSDGSAKIPLTVPTASQFAEFASKRG